MQTERWPGVLAPAGFHGREPRWHKIWQNLECQPEQNVIVIVLMF
jgi:hypothetical protein